MMRSEEEVRDIKRRYSVDLLKKEGVVGVGVEYDKSGNPLLAVTIDQDNPTVRKSIPKKIESCPVRIVKSERFKKQTDE